MYWKYVKFSNLLNKDTLAMLMRGNGQPWEVGIDISKEYIKQMASEHKREISPGKWRYVHTKGWIGNHLFDCETMQIVAASIYKVFQNHIDAD
jgi:hypothetical protein